MTWLDSIDEQAKLEMDLLGICLRLDQFAHEGFRFKASITDRIWTCDVPRLLNRVTPEGWEQLRETMPACWERLRTIAFEPDKAYLVYPGLSQ